MLWIKLLVLVVALLGIAIPDKMQRCGSVSPVLDNVIVGSIGLFIFTLGALLF